MGRSARMWSVLASLLLIGSLAIAAPAPAQDKPRSGGELVFVVAAEPPGFDGHREESPSCSHCRR